MEPTNEDLAYSPDVVYPPGDTLLEKLEELDMSQVELSNRTGLSAKHVNQIIQGNASVSPETALLLERATGVSATAWNRLELGYRQYRLRTEETAALKSDIGWLDELPIKALVKRGWVDKQADAVEQLREVLGFFGVGDRDAWKAMWAERTAYRKSKAFTSDPGAVAAWMRIGEIRAAAIRCEPFSKRALVQSIEAFKDLTCESDPGTWFPELERLGATVGIAVVAEPEIPGARINGATRWLSPTKALVQLSLRHKTDDVFWFTFFHEIGHLVLHSKKDAFINDTGSHSGVEQEADAFASKTLVPDRFVADLATLETDADVRRFAQRVGVSPGIVAGRLHHDQRWPYNRGARLKRRLEFASA